MSLDFLEKLSSHVLAITRYGYGIINIESILNMCPNFVVLDSIIQAKSLMFIPLSQNYFKI